MVKMDVKIVGGPRRKIERQGVPGREKVGNPCSSGENVKFCTFSPLEGKFLEIQKFIGPKVSKFH